MRTRAPAAVQASVFVIAFAAFFAAQIVNAVTREWLWVELLPIPVIVVMLACAVTVFTRSLWPAAGLAVLALGLATESIVINFGEPASTSKDVALRLTLGASFQLTAEVVVGALAGWLWCQREGRFVTVSDAD